MAETKCGKYFISETPPNPLHPQSRNKVSNMAWVNHPISINEEVYGKVKGAFWLEPNIVVRPSEGGPERGGRPHNHDFDEYLLFMSLDPDNMADLGGEVEFWVEEEKHIITKTTALFIPKGVYHCPFYIRRVDRPFGFIGIGNTLKYAHLSFSNDPKYAKYTYLDEIAEFSLGGKKYQITRTYADYLRWLNEKNREKLSE